MKTLIKVPSVFLGLLALAASLALATAQEREPPPALPMDCPTTFTIPGGSMQSYLGAEVTLPPGTYVRLLIPPETIYFGYCHVETGAQIAIANDCVEGSWYTPSEEAEEIVEQILASCRISDAPPQPYCPQGLTVDGSQAYTVEPDIRVTLPPGTFFIANEPSMPRTVTICAVQDNGLSMRYQTILSLNDCTQLGRSHIDGEDFVEAEAIPASCEVTRDTSADLPTPAPAGTRVVTGRSGITPPETGSGGLIRSP